MSLFNNILNSVVNSSKSAIENEVYNQTAGIRSNINEQIHNQVQKGVNKGIDKVVQMYLNNISRQYGYTGMEFNDFEITKLANDPNYMNDYLILEFNKTTDNINEAYGRDTTTNDNCKTIDEAKNYLFEAVDYLGTPTSNPKGIKMNEECAKNNFNKDKFKETINTCLDSIQKSLNQVNKQFEDINNSL